MTRIAAVERSLRVMGPGSPTLRLVRASGRGACGEASARSALE
jgi:hypothetical protein